MDTQIHRYKIISLDVWGHGPGEHEQYDCDGECDGYTVNDAHYAGRVAEVVAHRKVYNPGTPREFVDYHASDEDFRRALIDADMLAPAVKPGMIEVDGEADYTLYVNFQLDGDPEDGKPLFHLERVK